MFDQDEDYLTSATNASDGDACFSSSPPSNNVRQGAQPLATSSSACSRPKPPRAHDERTYLMSFVPQRLHHGSPDQATTPTYLSPQHGEDELYFDFDISSPESPADHEDDENGVVVNRCPHHYNHFHPADGYQAQKSAGPCGNGDGYLPPTIEEESGCISSVSSVITEQDNDEEDECADYFGDAEIACPWSRAPVVTLQPMPSSPTGPIPSEGIGGCSSPVGGKLGTIVEHALEESENSHSRRLPDGECDLGQGHGDAESGSRENLAACCSSCDAERELDSETKCAWNGAELAQSCGSVESGAIFEKGAMDEAGEPEGEWTVQSDADDQANEPDDFNGPVASDGDGDQPGSSHGEGGELGPSEETAAKNASDDGKNSFRVCVSPPPTFLNLRVVEPHGVASDADDRRHKTCLLTVDVSLSPSDNEALSPTPTDDDFPRRVRRSSSLKTGKTPPGTPMRKKIVRFADAMGLDLEAVKTVFLDDLPVVPSSAFVDLQDGAYPDGDDDGSPIGSLTIYNSNVARQLRFLPFGLGRPMCSVIPAFPQPGSLPDFADRVRKQNVCLESAVVTGDFDIRLVVRVLNLHFHKYVAVRYTFDSWASAHDQVAEYVAHSTDAFSDKFSTVLGADRLQVGERLFFAIQYVAGRDEFWDNNHGQNYCFQCFVEQQYQSSPPDDSWIHFL